jgi:hypothetical protein
MHKNSGLALSIALVLASLTGCGKKTYDECVLEHAKELTSKEAVAVITAACFEKYYEPTKFDSSTAKCSERRELNELELKLLDGRGDINRGYFHGTVYNGNKLITIEELTIGINYGLQKDSSSTEDPFEKYRTRPFVTDVKILPYAASDFSVKVLPKSNQYENTSWLILSAKTCK